MKIGIRFFLSWILSAITMFTLFYVWHGVFLNDFKRIQFPLTWFITFAAFSYLLIGAGMYFLFESRLMKRFESSIIRALITGIISGLGLVMIATVIHISLTKQLSMNHLLINCVWQVAEQSVGVMVMLVLKYVIREHVHEEI
ncbi:MAG: hypothetical protein IPM51_04655 [Sphingobacteriaceae bacterium]|nr:hypothetical protein [Sphingobacteriaceae bacterium]